MTNADRVANLMPMCLSAVAVVRMTSLVAGIVFAGSAAAGDWTLTDSAEAELTYVDRTGRNEGSGLVLQLTPGIKLAGRGGRSEADIDYRLTASVGGGGTDPKDISHQLRARGRVEVIENAFFLSGGASARLVGNNATSGSVDAINARSDGRQSYSFQLEPEFRHHLSQYADIVSRNRFDYVTYSGGSSDSDDGSTSTQANLGVRSGRYFGPLSWSLDATQRQTDYEDRDDKRTTYNLGLGYRIDARLQVRGTVGYEKNDIQTTRQDTDGGTWNLGFDWYPSPRTSVTATYGERYLGNVFSGGINHTARRTQLSLDFARDVSNRRTAQLIDSFFFLVDPDTGAIFVDPITGDPVLVNIPELQQIDEDFLNTQIRAAVSVTGRRSTATLTASASNRQYELSGRDEDSYGLSFRLTRRLGAGYTGALSSRLTRADGTSTGDSDTYDVRLSLNKRLSPRTSAALQVQRRERDGSDSTSDYTENRIGISLRSSFL